MATRIEKYIKHPSQLISEARDYMPRPSGPAIGGIIAVVAVAALAAWFYPEFRRYMHVRRM